ncbi:MAG: phospholipase D-like domain-containing protein [Candidatus Omnitrophota bacterium]
MRKTKRILLISAFLFTVLFSISFLSFADNSPLESATDLSDRKYEQALIELFDNAKEAIVISMYGISVGSDGNNPVRLLLNDLLEARARGVSVTMYLNTRFNDAGRIEESFIGSPVFKELKEAGCVINLIPKGRKLHDKLIIVDNRYVVVGSTNWSNSALRRNFESNTFIDSPRHAQEKLKRLENVLNFIKSNSEISDSPVYLQDLPEEFVVSKELLNNKKYLSSMVTRQDHRVFDLYFLLLAYSQGMDEKEFFINLEDMGLSLGLPDTLDHTSLRRQVIRSLKRLQDRYRLITVKFLHGKDADVTLLDIPGESFAASSGAIIQRPDRLTLRLKFLLLIQALLKDEGRDMSSMPQPALAKEFNVNKTTIYDAFDDLEKIY